MPASNPPSFRPGSTCDPPRFDGNGKLIRFYDTERMRRSRREMFARGVERSLSLLFSGWIGDGKFDYAENDRVQSASFMQRFMGRIHSINK